MKVRFSKPAKAQNAITTPLAIAPRLWNAGRTAWPLPCQSGSVSTTSTVASRIIDHVTTAWTRAPVLAPTRFVTTAEARIATVTTGRAGCAPWSAWSTYWPTTSAPAGRPMETSATKSTGTVPATRGPRPRATKPSIPLASGTARTMSLNMKTIGMQIAIERAQITSTSRPPMA